MLLAYDTRDLKIKRELCQKLSTLLSFHRQNANESQVTLMESGKPSQSTQHFWFPGEWSETLHYLTVLHAHVVQSQVFRRPLCHFTFKFLIVLAVPANSWPLPYYKRRREFHSVYCPLALELIRANAFFDKRSVLVS